VKINAAALLASYIECLDAAKEAAASLADADAREAERIKMQVDAFAKTADQYLGALKLIWPRLPEDQANALAKQAEAIAKAAFDAEKTTPECLQ
jgi:hypothetical protein